MKRVEYAKVVGMNAKISFRSFFSSLCKTGLSVQWKDLFEKHFLHRDYNNERIPKIVLNSGNPQRLAIINMINQHGKISAIKKKFPDFIKDEFLVCQYVEKNPDSFFQLKDWIFNENVIKSACKSFGDQSHYKFKKLRAIIEHVIQQKSLDKKQAISFRNDLIVQQPKLLLCYRGKRANLVNVQDIVPRNGNAIEFISKLDSGTLLDGIRQNGLVIQFASDEVLKDERIVRAALLQNPKAIQYCIPSNATDENYYEYPANSSNFLLDIFRVNGASCYQYLPERIRMRENLIMEALNYDGKLLEFVPKEPAVLFEKACKKALQKGTIRFVSDDIQLENKELVEECLSLNVSETLQYCHSSFLSDKKFIVSGLKEIRNQNLMNKGLQIIGNLVNRMKDCDSTLLTDEDIIYEIFVTSTSLANSDNAELIHEISNDQKFIERAAFDHKKWFIYACAHEKISLDMIKTLIEKHGFSSTLPDSLLTNEEIARHSIEMSILNIESYSYKFIRNLCTKYPGFEQKLLNLIESDLDYNYLINYLSDSKRTNKTYALEKISRFHETLKYFHIDLRNDPELMLTACRFDPSSVSFASRELLSSTQFIMDYLDEFPNSASLIAKVMSEELQSNKPLMMKIIGLCENDSSVLELILRNKDNILRYDEEIIGILKSIRQHEEKSRKPKFTFIDDYELLQ